LVTERRTAHANAVCFAKRPIGPRAINLVDMHRLGITAKSMMKVSICSTRSAPVVVVPTESIDKRKPLTTLIDSFALNSVSRPALPLDRADGRLARLTMRLSTQA
jgi:hypothetical protein